MVRVEGSYRGFNGNWSTIGYGAASDLPLLIGDGVSTVVVAGTSFNVATSVAIVLRGALAF
jgi:hypothetical protein